MYQVHHLLGKIMRTFAERGLIDVYFFDFEQFYLCAVVFCQFYCGDCSSFAVGFEGAVLD